MIVLEDLKYRLLKYFLLSFIYLSTNQINAQNQSVVKFNAGHLIGIEGSFESSDTLVLRRINFPDTVGLGNEDSEDVFDERSKELKEFLFTERFILDSAGNVTEYEKWAFCILGVVSKRIINVTEVENNIIFLVTYEQAGKTLRTWSKRYYYVVNSMEDDKVILLKTITISD